MRIHETILCDGCGVEVLWAPVKANNRDYCCQDCANGYECNCGARMEDEGYSRDQGQGMVERYAREGVG